MHVRPVKAEFRIVQSRTFDCLQGLVFGLRSRALSIVQLERSTSINRRRTKTQCYKCQPSMAGRPLKDCAMHHSWTVKELTFRYTMGTSLHLANEKPLRSARAASLSFSPVQYGTLNSSVGAVTDFALAGAELDVKQHD